ncbi:MAG: hypothetical protein QW570_09180 [Candidatus Caldarchaeum sp.]
MKALLIGLVLVLTLSAGALADDRDVIYKGSRPADYFDLLALKESSERMMLIVGLGVIIALAAVIFYRTSHVRSEIEKKVEDEFNEIKETYRTDLDPKTQVLTDNQRLQNLKDVFQTIAQGQAPLWKGGS